MADATAAYPAAPAALRLTFERSPDGAIALRDAQPVAKRAPASDPPTREPAGKAGTAAALPAVGMWLELLDGDRPVWRRQVRPMFPDSHEVQTGNPERPFARAPRSRPYRVEILVPAPPAARAGRVVLRERRADPDVKRGTPPREIVHLDVPLEKLDPQRPPTTTPKGSP